MWIEHILFNSKLIKRKKYYIKHLKLLFSQKFSQIKMP